jgi:single-stranded-DNA-specific exonuclease
MKKWILSNTDLTSQDIVGALLRSRGLTSSREVKGFLEPPTALSWAKAFPPEFKKALLDAKSLINDFMQKNAPIVIHGDYDADGICATAILYNTLKNELGYEKTYFFIPNRFSHGYGLSVKSVDEVVQIAGSPENLLIVTVDSGITATSEGRYIKEKGYSLIITDHHQKPDTLPEAECIVWNDSIVGAGISWFLSKTLGSKNTETVALAGLATVTDLQPLLKTNRSLVKEGLEILNSNPPKGLKKLLQVAGKSEGEITTYELGWILGPRLNAAGRLVSADESVKLLIEHDEDVLEEAALALNQTNISRQDKTLEMYEVANVSDKENLPKIIISANENYHEGIIGLVAAKLAQKYYRPAIVISLNGTHAKGSVRSIPGIDIISALRNFEDFFVSLGGHPMAAGFTILKENLKDLELQLNDYFDKTFEDELFQPFIEIDLNIDINQITPDLLEKLSCLKPYGVGNKEPVFMSEKVGVAGINVVGREANHLSFRFYKNNSYYKGIWFGSAERLPEFNVGDNVDLVYKLKESEFNGAKKIDLIIEDIRKAL